MIYIIIVQFSVQAIPVLVLPQERTTGLGCIPEGRNVSYQCTVTDTTNPPIGSTVWGGDAFQCPSTANQIRLPHSQFNSPVPLTCGSFSARAVGVDGINYVSQLSLTAASELNGTTLFCSLSDTEEETVSDVLTIGGESTLPYTHSKFNSVTKFSLQFSPLLLDHSQSLSPLIHPSLSVGVHPLVQWRVEWVGTCLV